ncbi:NapC/NirT family cytochrome c [candidate division KSB1 bacterium]|nr:NapC/NirT family cytochrome c [candidate division KSB1 bacterium]
MKLRLPYSFYNLTSYIGAVIALIALFMFIFLYALTSISGFDKAYIGIVIFIVIPFFLILGLLLIPIGMLNKIRRQKKSGEIESRELPVLNLNLPNHRNATIIFAIGTTLFLFLSAFGSYHAYHFTESNRFCGTLCHKLMVPEYTSYQLSPHARVKCAECHIGSGANWYVKSKLSGLYQVYATVANVYPQPIPTPIKNLRPARETCEECHWPQKVYGKQQRKEFYYLPDEDNTRWEIDLLMNTGGGNPALGQSSGIHWHVNSDIDIEYITTDEKRSSIPRVIQTNKVTGEQIIYNNIEEPLEEGDGEDSFRDQRVMDCIDCHNRPGHIYNDPSKFINISLASGLIDDTLPLIKQVAVEACLQEYETTEQAFGEIKNYIQSFYQENYPEITESKNREIEKSIAGVQQAFSQNIFPEMKVRWENYPDYIGHMTSQGCFRCHDGKHAGDNGEMISHECVVCHLITSQGTKESAQHASMQESLDFQHPIDIGEEWREIGCYECHSTPPL